jgi:exonuclease SbcC
VKPLQVSIENLRSYRDRTMVDFTGKSLMAIIGDTGAGKSSILHAIAGALFNRTLWDGRGLGSLIATGQNTLTVDLLFQADGKRWRVIRSTSRTLSPPSVHSLICEDDARLSFSGEAAVTSQIESLLGMDFDAFQAAVLLPQGDFAQLLHASPKVRAQIIKGVFRLDALEQLRHQVDAIAGRASDVWTRLDQKRHDLPENPSALAQEARASLQISEKHLSQLVKLLKAVRTWDAEREQLEAKVKKMEAASNVLGGFERRSTASLEALLPIAKEIVDRLAHLSPERERLASREALLRQKLKEADDAGESLQALTQAEEKVRQVRGRLEAVARRQEELVRAADQIESRLRQQKARLALVGKLRADHLKMDKELQGAVTAVAVAEDAWRSASQGLREARAASTAVASARATATAHQTTVINAVARRKDADAEWERREAAYAAADQALESGRRAHSAVHAAAGLQPGDPCPVCSRVLPSGFKPPAHAPLEPLEDAAKVASESRRLADQAKANAMSAVIAGQARLKELEADIAVKVIGEAALWGRLRELVPSLDPTATDEEILRPLVALGSERRHQEHELRDRTAAAQQAHADAKAKSNAEDSDLKRAAEELASNRTAVEAERTACRIELSSLPAFVARPIEATAEACQPIGDLIASRMKAASEAAGEYDKSLAELRNLDREIAALENKMATEVAAPQRKAMEALSEMRPRLNDCGSILIKPIEERRRPADNLALVELIEYARDLEKCAEQTLVVSAEEISLLNHQIAELEAKVASSLNAQKFADRASAEAAHTAAVGDVAVLKRALAESERLIPLVAELERDRSRAYEISSSLGELRRLLPGFETYVTNKRTRDLLAVGVHHFHPNDWGALWLHRRVRGLRLAQSRPAFSKDAIGWRDLLGELGACAWAG